MTCARHTRRSMCCKCLARSSGSAINHCNVTSTPTLVPRYVSERSLCEVRWMVVHALGGACVHGAGVLRFLGSPCESERWRVWPVPGARNDSEEGDAFPVATPWVYSSRTRSMSAHEGRWCGSTWSIDDRRLVSRGWIMAYRRSRPRARTLSSKLRKARISERNAPISSTCPYGNSKNTSRWKRIPA